MVKMGSVYSSFAKLCELNIIKSALLLLRQKAPRVLIFRRVHTSISSSGTITGNGTLQLGKRWPGLSFFQSELKLSSKAKIVVRGKFIIFTGFHISVEENAKLTLGSGYINNGVTIDCFDSVSIGHDVAISKGVTIRDSDNHDIGTGGPISAPIVVGDHVWIGVNATILKGVTIGAGAVIAAGAVVTRDVPAQACYGGVPARLIRKGVIWT